LTIKQGITTLSTFIILIAAWELLAALNLYHTALIPPPSDAVLALAKLWENGTLQTDIAASASRYLPGFLIGSVVGVIVGVLSGISKYTNYAVSPLFHYLRSIPPVALIPFALVLFGIGDLGKICLIAWASMFPVWLSTYSGMKQVPKEYLQAAQIFGVNGFRRIIDVWVPCSLPYIVSGLRIGVATGIFALAAAEMFAASSGIAFRIVYSHQLFQTDAMVGMILLLGLIALLADLVLATLKNMVVRWEKL
jgi:ABC-type nitrate/sulfonate/bicarbonate transport system permease component